MSAGSFDYVIKCAFFVILCTIFAVPTLISRMKQFGKNASNGMTGIPFRVMNWKGSILYAVIATFVFAIVIGMEWNVFYYWSNPFG